MENRIIINLFRKGLFVLLGITISLSLFGHDEISKKVVKITMPDGVNLAADLFLPDNKEPLPCILIRTPYGKHQHEPEGMYWAENGYAVIIQDTRGKWDSEGEFFPFVNEKDDGISTLDWIVEQDWCNGQIGMWGSSYLSFCAFVVAAENHPALKSAFVVSGWLQGTELIKPGGAMHLMLSLAWILHEETQKVRNLGNYEMDEMFEYLPLIDAFSSVGILSNIWTDHFMEWEEKSKSSEASEINIPMYHITGWWDFVHEASLNAYSQIVPESKHLQKLKIGPWFHDQIQTDYTESGDANYGPQSIMGRAMLNEITVRWFDHTIKGIDNGIDKEPDVEYFLMGKNEWVSSDTWPPENEKVDLFLSSIDGANTKMGDGTLLDELPLSGEKDQYLFNPNDPVPTHGGDNFHFFLHTMGYKDQSDLEEREDVLVYTSSPLEEEISICGQVSVSLFVSTEGKDTDFTAKLIEVQENGYAGILMDGIRRLSYRESITERLPVVPGEVYEIDIDLGYTAVTIPAGRCLRLEISSSNFPKFDRNPNTGEEAWHSDKLMPVNQTVYHGKEFPSRITLPIVKSLKSE